MARDLPYMENRIADIIESTKMHQNSARTFTVSATKLEALLGATSQRKRSGGVATGFTYRSGNASVK